jgi:hypothetical protein
MSSSSKYYHIVGTIIGFAIAQLMAIRFHAPIIGWFVGGTIIALSASYSFPQKTPRSHALNITLSILVGVATSAIMNFMTV